MEGLLGTPGLPTWITGLADAWLEWAVWPADPARSPLRSLQQRRSPKA